MRPGAWLVGPVALLSASCAHLPEQCAANPGSLRCRAAVGEKQAQLELGRAYEEGTVIVQDLRHAVRLYEAAASPTSGTTYVYSPPVGKEKAGRVIPVRVGPDRPGLSEAKLRLARMYLTGRGVRLDRDRGIRLLRQAAREGSALAQAELVRIEAD